MAGVRYTTIVCLKPGLYARQPVVCLNYELTARLRFKCAFCSIDLLTFDKTNVFLCVCFVFMIMSSLYFCDTSIT